MSLDLLDGEFLRDPYPTYARLRRDEPVLRHPLGFTAVLAYDDCVRVLRDEACFSSRLMRSGTPDGVDPEVASRLEVMQGASATLRLPGPSLIGMDGSEHARVRAVVARGFVRSRVAALDEMVRAIVDELLAPLEGAASCDLVEDLASRLPIAVVCRLLGLPDEERDALRRWTSALQRVATSAAGPQAGQDAVADVGELTARLTELLERRARDPRDDLISLIAAPDAGLSRDEQIDLVSLLLSAGADNTANLIGNTALALLSHPEQLCLLRRRPEDLPAAIEEALRYDAPAQLMARIAERDVRLRGVDVGAGEMLIVVIGSANRDEARFAQADRFEISRGGEGHLAFGMGSHFCLGASLARLEARRALGALLWRFPGLRLGEGLVERSGSFLLRGPKRLPVVLDA